MPSESLFHIKSLADSLLLCDLFFFFLFLLAVYRIILVTEWKICNPQFVVSCLLVSCVLSTILYILILIPCSCMSLLFFNIIFCSTMLVIVSNMSSGLSLLYKDDKSKAS
jgi:hypothetical protein